MKLKLKFVDGQSVIQDISNSTFSGNGNFFELVQIGIERNAPITIENEDSGEKIERTFSELKSIELILQ